MIQGSGSSTQSTLSDSAVTVDRFESIALTRPGSATGKPRKAGQSGGPISISFRTVAS